MLNLAKSMIVVMIMKGFVDKVRQPFWSCKADYCKWHDRSSCSHWHGVLLGCSNNPNRNNRDDLQYDLKCTETLVCSIATFAVHHMRPVPENLNKVPLIKHKILRFNGVTANFIVFPFSRHCIRSLAETQEKMFLKPEEINNASFKNP